MSKDDPQGPGTGVPAPHPLKALRTQLDHIDGDIVRLIAARLETVGLIVKAKSGRQDTIRDPAREREVLSKVEERARALGVSGALVRKIFADIIAHSVAVQATTISGGDADAGRACRVALLGGTYSYDHLAAEQYLSGRGLVGHYETCETLEAAVERLASGDVDLLLLPIENTFAGSMNPVYDLLREHELHIVGEETYKIDHCLAAMADVPPSALERIYGHPNVLEQCSAFIKGLPRARAVTTRDSAEALELVARSLDPSQAVIAAPEGAAAHGLSILRHAVGNQEEILCRFVALAREPLRVDPRVPCKTSLILTTRHEHGALLKCLQVLSDFGVSLTKLESRPRRNRPWEYMFFIDFEGHVEMTHVAAALDSLRAQALYLKILGCYPSKATPSDPQAAALKVAVEPRDELKGPRERLSDRTVRPSDTVIRVADLLIGGEGFTVVAGPAYVESRAQIDAAAASVHAAGAHILRGNVFAATSEPGAFEGLGAEGLDHLAAAGKAFNLPIMTEVTSPEEVRLAAEKADLLLVGARNMQNFALLAELAKVDRPVVLKRGLSSTIDEWLASAEYVISHGNGQVILCERGIRTFESTTRNTLDLSAVVVLRERTHLPVLVDPSQGTGKRSHVLPMAKAARACGAHGLMLMMHPDPEHAKVGGEQSLNPEEFGALVSAVALVKP
ncbi:MAG: bifunctional 3-deoxy-7-phosphoheptulonate synthase/chorismate mutase [Myxococcales bacterium]|nr:bifunctional 3-deoxy-7-phosphoheptulonate synthase/chorismate mutase [Myxococcales bacterium]